MQLGNENDKSYKPFMHTSWYESTLGLECVRTGFGEGLAAAKARAKRGASLAVGMIAVGVMSPRTPSAAVMSELVLLSSLLASAEVGTQTSGRHCSSSSWRTRHERPGEAVRMRAREKRVW